MTKTHATGILLNNSLAEVLEMVSSIERGEQSPVLFTEPGVGAFGSLRAYEVVKQKKFSHFRRKQDALRILVKQNPDAETFRLLAPGSDDGPLSFTRETAAEFIGRSEPKPPIEKLATNDGTQSAPPIVFSKRAKGPADASRYQIMIKSFKRFPLLRRLIYSIKRFYPDARIIVADDSFEALPPEVPPAVLEIQQIPGVTWLQLPFDSGLSAGRNRMIEFSSAEILISLDDDFVFTEETKLEHWLQILDHDPRVDLVAGLLRHNGRVATHWGGHFRFTAKGDQQELKIEPLRSEWENAGDVKYRNTDLALNFFAARRKTLVDCPWDEEFKIVGEHLDHFLDMNRKQKHIVYTPCVLASHYQEHPSDYREFRMRKDEPVRLLLQKWNLTGLPKHIAYNEPAVPNRPLLSATVPTMMLPTSRPNIVVLGVGHSGTTILTSMVESLGWNLGPADSEFSEHVRIRQLNDRLLHAQKFNATAAAKELEQLPQPWAIKDPRFVNTLDAWREVLTPYEPLLVWITKNNDQVEQSYRRRYPEMNDGGPVKTRGKTIPEALEACGKLFETWPWEKLRIDYAQLHRAVELFDLRRSPTQRSSMELLDGSETVRT